MPTQTDKFPEAGEIPAQTQLGEGQPGKQYKMEPLPHSVDLPSGYDAKTLHKYKAAGKLEDRKALITGGDSGIGRSCAVLFAMEGADVAINYLQEEQKDAEETKKMIEKLTDNKRKCLLVPADISVSEANCKEVVEKVVNEFGRIDILVNNAAIQHMQDSILNISSEQLEKTFRTNIFSQFWLTKAALHHIPHHSHGSIINSTSVVAFKGSAKLLDYSSTKGAIVAFTRSLALQLQDAGIRVNGVAPGPIWTPLQPASRPADNTESFGQNPPLLGRVGQPSETATPYVFLASDDSSYLTGQIMHVNGGMYFGQ